MKGYRDTRLLEMLDYIDPKYIEKTKKYYKSVPVSGAAGAKIDPKKQIKYITALVAAVLLLSAFIPAVTYIIQNHLHFAGYSETTGGDTTLAPEITSEEITSSPEPESSAPETTETEPTHETTEPLYDGTTAPPEIEYDGSRGLVYKLSEDGKSACLFGMGTCTDENIVVASTYDGVPVTAIGKGALAGYDRVKSVAVPDTVTTIENQAFAECKGIEKVDLPDSITHIGDEAFVYCTSLKKITLPKNLTELTLGVLSYCKSLEEIIIPEAVTEISTGAFLGCDVLQSFRMHANVKKIGTIVFNDCPKLTSLDFAGTVEQWNSVEKEQGWNYDNVITTVHCTDGNVEITSATQPEIEHDGSQGLEYSISEDGYAIFAGIGTCTDSDIVIATEYGGYPVKAIAAGALSGQKNVRRVVIPEGISEIPSQAFYECTALKSVKIPSTVKIIGRNAFQGCSSLVEIAFPTGLEKIDQYGFSQCTALESIRIEGRTTIKNYAFTHCSSLREVELGDSVTFDYTHIFNYCTSLESIRIPKRVTRLTSLFEGCTKLREVIMHDDIDDIDVCFYNCPALESFYIGPKVQILFGTIFYGCPGVKEIVYGGTMHDWYTIEKSSTWRSGAPNLKVIKCIDGEITNLNADSAAGSFGLLYEMNADGESATFRGFREGVNFGLEVEIATYYYGKPVTRIADELVNAAYFSGTLILPNGVESIGESQFDSMPRLKGVVLPKNLKSIDKDAFRGAPEVNTVTYLGSMAEWEKIKKNERWNYTAVFTTVHCSDGDLSITPFPETSDGSQGLKYYINSNGYAVFAGIGTCTESDIVIATEYRGYPVKAIAEGALRGKTNVRHVVIPEGITEIPKSAFYECTALESVTIPSTVKIIGEHAFQDCSSLHEIALPAGLEKIDQYGFSRCTALKKLEIPDGVSEIGYAAFSSLDSVERIYIPKSVTELGWMEFNEINNFEIDPKNPKYAWKGNCFIDKETKTLITMFKNAVIPDDGSVEIIGEDAFGWERGLTELILPEGVKHMRNLSIYGFEGIEYLHLPSTFAGFDEYALRQCIDLKKITVAKDNPHYYVAGDCLIDRRTDTVILGLVTAVIPDDGSIKHIGDRAFADLSIESIRIPEGVVSIETGAFSGCAKLKEVILPESLESIGVSAFWCCSSLKKIELGENVRIIGNSAFAGCEALEEILLPEDIESIGESAFSSCRALKRVVLPKGFEGEHYIFSSCNALGEVVLPDGMKLIGRFFFGHCYILENIEIPDSVTEIAYDAFYSCSALKSIVIPKSVASIDSKVFAFCDALEEIYYDGSIEEWNRIEKHEKWLVHSSVKVIHCTDGDLAP